MPFILVTLVACLTIVSGCATTKYPRAYKVDGKDVEEFKDLTDDQALKVLALIYNVAHDTWEDGMARSIAIDRYLDLLKKRNSAYIKKSGVFEMQHDKIKLSSWNDDDLMKLYDTLYPVADSYYMNSAQKLTEAENARRIVYLTAVCSIEEEIDRRKMNRNAIAIAGNVLSTAIMVALSMI